MISAINICRYLFIYNGQFCISLSMYVSSISLPYTLSLSLERERGERELGRYECNGRQVPTSTHDILLICMYVYPCTFSKDILGMVHTRRNGYEEFRNVYR